MSKYYFIFILFFSTSLTAQNPVIRHMYTADPSARVFNDTLWIYPSHDRDSAKWWDMEDWHVFSTTDLKHFTDHGKAIGLDEISWAQKYAWAPDCVQKNGKYYFYYPTDAFHIGVAVSERPCGPFIDPLGHPLVSKTSDGIICNRDFIDPAVFIEDDGTPYLFMGQNTINAVQLNEDMISYQEPVHIIEGVPDFFEAVWVHKYNGHYYISYSGRGQILYAMSKELLGPYTFKGVILDKVNSGTNHHSIVEYKGKWYLFYHTSDLALENIPSDSPEREYIQWRRSVCFDELFYNEDGTIQEVNPTNANYPVK